MIVAGYRVGFSFPGATRPAGQQREMVPVLPIVGTKGDQPPFDCITPAPHRAPFPGARSEICQMLNTRTEINRRYGRWDLYFTECRYLGGFLGRHPRRLD